MSGNKKKKLVIFLLAVIAAFVWGVALSGIYSSRNVANTVATEADLVETTEADPDEDEEVTTVKALSEKAAASYLQEEDKAQSSVLGASREENKAFLPDINLSELKETNPDIIAWVTIPGTKIDYPIAQHPTDDEYYLKHGASGMSSSEGCPYIELCDSGSFMEFNTVIYGHNMNDGSMFASLHDFEDESFFSEHRDLYIYTEEHLLTYKIFAAVMFDDRRIPYYFDDNLESDRTAFLQAINSDIVADRSVVSNDTEVNEDNCIVTLSTCDKKLRDKRFLVVAVLTKIDGQEAGQ